jgi:DNA polymerase III epsilon subunit-like protein
MIVVDVETTGLDPRRHSIVSIGAVDFSNPEDTFYGECRIWEGAEVSEEALLVNGFSKNEVADKSKMPLEQLMRHFISWMQHINDRTLAGANPSFDRDFLKASVERCRITDDFAYRTIDLHSLCYTHYLKREISPPLSKGRTNISTDSVLKYVGMPPEPKPHIALTGAKMEAEAFCRLIKGKYLFKEFEKYSVPDYLNQLNAL